MIDLFENATAVGQRLVSEICVEISDCAGLSMRAFRFYTAPVSFVTNQDISDKYGHF